MAKKSKNTKSKDDVEVVFESIEIGNHEHLWQYEDKGKAMLDAIYGMIGGLCPGCQLKTLSMICAATICDIVEEGQNSFEEILIKLIKETRQDIKKDQPRPN